MINPPQPDRRSKIDFKKRCQGAGTKIEHYPTAQTIEILNQQIVAQYDKELNKALVAGKPDFEAKIEAQTKAKQLPEFCAVQKWQDVNVEVKVKKAVENLMKARKIPALVIRSIDIKKISALKDMGIDIPDGDGEIDLVLVYATGDLLNVILFEVKRADIYPWNDEDAHPGIRKEAVKKAENQLTKDVKFFNSFTTGQPPSNIRFHTLACFPDTSIQSFQSICSGCLQRSIVCREDLDDLTLLREKLQVPDRSGPATERGRKLFLTLGARILSHHSLLHVGYRIGDKKIRASEKQSFNEEFIDKKMQQRMFVMASPQQQQVIANFTCSLAQRHLVLDGPAGTGKTLVALKVANDLHDSISCQGEGDGPLLIVTAHGMGEDHPLMSFLDSSTGERANKRIITWEEILNDFGCIQVPQDKMLLHLTTAFANQWEGRNIVMVMDEISERDCFQNMKEQAFPETVRMILVLNPTLSSHPLTLPHSFLHVTLKIPYRSTNAINSLACHVAKSENLSLPSEFGTDVEGAKPIFYDAGVDEDRLHEALMSCQKQMGETATILYHGNTGYSTEKRVRGQEKESGVPWEIYPIYHFYGWEADKVIVMTSGQDVMELITRAKVELAVIIVDEGDPDDGYEKLKEVFHQAAQMGLVEKLQL